MADLSFGSTFQPGDQNGPSWMRPGGGGGGGGSQGGAGFSPVQQAVKVLSLRLPQVFGAQAPLAHALMGGGAQSHVGPTQASGVGQSIVGSNQGQTGYGAGGSPSLPPVRPPAASNIAGIIKKKIPGMVGPDSAAQLAQIIAQLPRNVPPPNISMIRPGGGGYPTQLPQAPQMPAYMPAPPQPTIVPIGAAGPNGNVYTGPPAQGPQPPMVTTAPSQYGSSGGYQYPTSFNPYGNGPQFRTPY